MEGSECAGGEPTFSHDAARQTEGELVVPDKMVIIRATGISRPSMFGGDVGEVQRGTEKNQPYRGGVITMDDTMTESYTETTGLRELARSRVTYCRM